LTENAIELFWLEFSPNTKLRDNNFTHFAVGGDVDTHFVHDIDTSNLVNEKPVYYWINRENAEVPSDAGYVALINCLNVTVRGLHFENGSQSIMMFSTNNSRILNNNITNIAEGIWILSSSNNIIYGNNITGHFYGIYLYRSSNSTVHGNNITANGVGIWLARSSNNSIFHNSFINNGVQVNSYKSTSIWDVGYPSGGNYWSNYNGTDADHDGIGDTPYIIDANNTDHYPLLGMFNSYNVTYYTPPLVPHACSVIVISNSTISDFEAPIWIEHPEVMFLMFNVSGAEGSTGFCRVSFPTAMMNGTYHVSVNGTEIPYTLLSCSDANCSYLYFTYTHSTQEVIIIPEFPSFLLVPLFMLTTLAAVFIVRRKKFPEEVENSRSELRLTRTGFRRNLGDRITRV
jgi:parallel beta-helix repeat protein